MKEPMYPVPKSVLVKVLALSSYIGNRLVIDLPDDPPTERDLEKYALVLRGAIPTELFIGVGLSEKTPEGQAILNEVTEKLTEYMDSVGYSGKGVVDTTQSSVSI